MSTGELVRRLDELGAELKVRDRPERRAFRLLEPNRHGWTARPYADPAFELWHGLLRRFPDDLHSVHHLAIMHHARAIDLEQSEHPGRSDDDWRQALALWCRLYEAAEFWTELSARIDADPDPVPDVRQDLIERLLRVHFDIALDERSPHHRARFHVQLALGSPFPAELIEGVRSQAYERAVAGQKTVLHSRTIDPVVLRLAIQTVIRYLELDDGYVTALKDLLGLVDRLGLGQIQNVNGSTNGPDEERGAIEELMATAHSYDGYVSRLESLLLAAAEPDELALSRLAQWHSVAAQPYQATGAHDDAARHYERAYRAARAGADPRAREWWIDWLWCTTLAARKHAPDDGELARRLLASTETPERVPGWIPLIRAQTWMLLGDFDQADHAIALALSALDLLQRDEDARWGDRAELRTMCGELRDRIHRERLARKVEPLMEEATRAMDTGNWDEALGALDAALAIDPDCEPALLGRAECHLGRYETPAARADLDQAERVASAADDGPIREVIQQLRDTVASVEEQVGMYGGAEAYRLWHAAVAAHNDDRLEEAINLLRCARAITGPGNSKINADLAHCLNAAAVQLVSPIARQVGTGVQRDRATLDRAEEMLVEAKSLDPARDDIAQNLVQITLLRALGRGAQ